MPASQPLVHNVFFTLKDSSEASIKRQIDACEKYLRGHDGEVFFCVARLVPDLARPVNVLDYHVGLHMAFASRAAHDAYQVHPRHQQFIEENKENWAQVRVYDTQ
ncbi:MAG: Dabb family protein [Planctomycetaceae bacterium]|nr:Dabb family protein [Planctomycetaceae bacterium]